MRTEYPSSLGFRAFCELLGGRILGGALALCALLASACGGGGGGGGGDNLPLSLTAEPFYASAAFLVGLAFTPDGDTLVTELQTGRVLFIPKDTNVPLEQPFAVLPVPNDGVRGLLGIAVDPDFRKNHWVYVYDTAPAPLRNRVVRLEARDNKGINPKVIIDNIPAGGHDGGKFAFDESGNLFVSTGDAGLPDIAQDLQSLGGKILRIGKDGEIPSDNPFPGSPVYALGFRNVFGMALHPDGETLFASDNGPDCDDEVNQVLPGGNFGWRSEQACGESDPRFLSPVFSISPSAGVTGILFAQDSVISELDDSLLVAGFNKGEIRRLHIEDGKSPRLLDESVVFPGGSGSIIDLAQAPNGEIFFSTSNGIFRLSKPKPS